MTKLSDANGNTPSEDGVARCPQCELPLDIVDRSTVVGYACHGCGGIWLDSDTTTRVERALDTQSIQVGEIADGLAENPSPPHLPSPPCPLCLAPMRSFVVPGSDVEVDCCSIHGTWFDRGELQTLMRELMSQYGEVAAEMPATQVREKMIARYGIDPTNTPGQLPTILKDLVDAWELLTEGKVLPGNRD